MLTKNFNLCRFQNELARLELQVIDTRNAYIINVDQMNFALKFYVEKCIDDLDKVEAKQVE